MRRLLWMMALALGAAAEIPEPAREYRQLRTQVGHFQGGAWNDQVDRWGGRKQQLMSLLGERLAQAQESTIREWMGEPDEVWLPRKGQRWMVNNDQQHRILIYRWRGMHDFLYFVMDGPKSLGSHWWMAGE